jgi:hypothetical protein
MCQLYNSDSTKGGLRTCSTAPFSTPHTHSLPHSKKGKLYSTNENRYQVENIVLKVAGACVIILFNAIRSPAFSLSPQTPISVDGRSHQSPLYPKARPATKFYQYGPKNGIHRTTLKSKHLRRGRQKPEPNTLRDHHEMSTSSNNHDYH